MHPSSRPRPFLPLAAGAESKTVEKERSRPQPEPVAPTRPTARSPATGVAPRPSLRKSTGAVSAKARAFAPHTRVGPGPARRPGEGRTPRGGTCEAGAPKPPEPRGHASRRHWPHRAITCSPPARATGDHTSPRHRPPQGPLPCSATRAVRRFASAISAFRSSPRRSPDSFFFFSRLPRYY